MTLLEILKLVWPLLLIEGGIRAYCVVLIWRDGVRSLNKWAWTAIVVVFTVLGWSGFLALGRKQA